ncbi:MAG: type VI secretion protein, partial [Thermoanaerobaculia bacterium]
MTSSKNESPLVRYLRDPNLLLHDALELAHDTAGLLAPVAPVAGGVVLALLLAWLAIRRLRERRRAAGARLVSIGVPPDVDADGATLLWSALHDLLRPRLARFISGQPQLAWEITAGERGIQFRLWIPQSVPPGLVERALASAWPGVTVTVEPEAREALPPARELAAVELVLSGPQWFPLGGSERPDPLRLVLG